MGVILRKERKDQQVIAIAFNKFSQVPLNKYHLHSYHLALIHTEHLLQQRMHTISLTALLSQVKLTCENMIPYISIFSPFPASVMIGSRSITQLFLEHPPGKHYWVCNCGKTVLAILVATVIWRQTGNSQFCLLLSQCLWKIGINIKPLDRCDLNAKKTYYILAPDKTIHFEKQTGSFLPTFLHLYTYFPTHTQRFSSPYNGWMTEG